MVAPCCKLLILDFDNDTAASSRLFLISVCCEVRNNFSFCGLSCLLVLQSWPVHSFFLTMNQTADFAASKVFTISLFFSLMIASLTYFNISFGLIFTITIKLQWEAIRYTFNTLNQLQITCLLHSWHNKWPGLTWPWNCLSVSCPINFVHLKWCDGV